MANVDDTPWTTSEALQLLRIRAEAAALHWLMLSSIKLLNHVKHRLNELAIKERVVKEGSYIRVMRATPPASSRSAS